MRAAFLPFVALLAIALASACSSSGGANPGGGGNEAGIGDGAVVDAQPIPMTEACTGAATACLSGKASTKKFQASPTQMEVQLYRSFPSGTATPLMKTTVALDGTWALSNVPAWSHYYLELVADFAQQSPAAASYLGPVTVPSKGSIALTVEPVQLQLLEQSGSAAGFEVESAAANVYDPTSGGQLSSAAVTITVGGMATPMPWTMVNMSDSYYLVQFMSPPAAQPTYTVDTTAPPFGASAATWQLVAAPPTFTGTVSSPASGATIPHGQPLTVTWAPQPAADYVVVELFELVKGNYVQAYASPQPDAADAMKEVIPGSLIPAGPYLLDVFFSTANCPATADGCVLASAVTGVTLTAQ